MILWRRLLAVPALAAVFAWAVAAQAQYPEGPIRLIIAFPGGSSEAQARILAKALSLDLGQAIVVQAQPGAGGNMASAYVAKARPDGYTILLGSNTFFETNPLIYPDIGYKLTDLVPVSILSEQPYVLVVKPALPVNSVRELIANAKQNPGKLINATAGLGSPVELAAAAFASHAGIRFLNVPYKGGGEDSLAVLGGFADLEFGGVTDVTGNIRAGKMRALGVTSTHRVATLAEVPTIAEAGLPGYDFTTWNCIFVPAATPKPIVDRLNAAIVKAIADPTVQASFAQIGFVPVSSTSAQAARRLATESQDWKKIFAAQGPATK